MKKGMKNNELGRREAIAYAQKLTAGTEPTIKDFDSLVEVLMCGIAVDIDAVEQRDAVDRALKIIQRR